jgi:hypothetical protein
MANDCKPYVEFAPGDLITAEGMNEMQVLVCQDICKQVEDGVAGVTEVETAKNALKLGGKTTEEICKEWLEKALQAIPKRSGYLKVFKRLKENEINLIEHNLKACPLVDVYQLLPFQVVCAIDEDKEATEAYFYLYHTSEKKIKAPDGTSVEIEHGDLPIQFKMPLFEILELFEVPYTDDSSLGDLETELWKAMFSSPNDDFDMDDYCHSPWFERCCREERTVGSIRKKGDADDLFMKYIPKKTINMSPSLRDGDGNNSQNNSCPKDLTVAHFNMNTTGLMWEPSDSNTERETQEQKVMVLLKV